MLNEVGLKGTFFVIPVRVSETVEDVEKRKNDKRAWGTITWDELKSHLAMKRLLLLLLHSALVVGQWAFGAEGPATPPAKESFHIYLLMGQSNMAGRDTRTLASQTTNPRVLAMTADGQWVVAKDPIHQKDGRSEPGAGPGIPFALEMLKSDPNVTIGLVPCAVGGTPLKRLVKGGDLYVRALERTKLASPSGKISGVLWLQGETDSDKQPWANTYEARLKKMLQDLRQDIGRPNLPIVVGQIGEFLPVEKHPYVDTVRAALRNVPAELPNVGYADSAGLGDKGDHLHFDAADAQAMGSRFAEAMRKVQDK